jgi:NADPH-dependent 2,4-dienoyl-CoA reductase/sulfur reductase-like enzyme
MPVRRHCPENSGGGLPRFVRNQTEFQRSKYMMLAIVGYDVLIVGSGHGGAQAAAALRQSKFTGSIGLLGNETELPYERPPLSKDYLSGERTLKRILLRPASFWSERDIKLLPGRRIVSVDPRAHSVTCADGSSIAYGTLIWATGGTPRRLICAGHDLDSRGPGQGVSARPGRTAVPLL